MDDTMTPVSVMELTKSFGDTVALDSISFDVKEGELFGFIGPDGAGKTTLFRIIATLITPDAGSARVLGFDSVTEYAQIRRRMGYMPGRFSLYQDLSVEENLGFFATLFGTTVEANYDLVRSIYGQLEPFRDRRAGALSGGMKQKLALSCALIHRPDILCLDEPTTGVDAVSRREFWDVLADLRASGLTTIVSTPYMDEAGRCDRVALIQEGRIMGIDTPQAIAGRTHKPLLAVKASDRYRLLQSLREYPYTRSVHSFGEYVHYTDTRRSPDADEIRTFLDANGLSDIVINSTEPSVEDAFMELMQVPDYESRSGEAASEADEKRLPSEAPDDVRSKPEQGL